MDFPEPRLARLPAESIRRTGGVRRLNLEA